MLLKRHFGSIRRLHTVAGILVMPLLIVASLTGIAYAFAPEIENVVYRDELTAAAGVPAVSLAQQVGVAQSAYPDLELTGLRVPENPTETTRVLFKDGDKTLAVFVDPVTATVRGALHQYGGSAALPLRTWLSYGHKNLWLGTPGRIYSELAASWLGAMAIGGLAVYFFRRRATGTLRWHSRIGLWALPGMLFLTITGLTWSWIAGANIGRLRTALNWKAPQIDRSLPAGGVDAAANAGLNAGAGAGLDGASSVMPVDTVYASARHYGLEGYLNILVPTAEKPAWSVAEARQPFRTSLDALALDDAGHITAVLPFRDWPLAAKLTNWLIELHMGTLFGVANKLVLVAISLAILALSWTGLKLWFKRGRRFAGPQKLSPWVVAFVVLYSIIAPLFGLSILVFWLVDTLYQRLKPARKTSAGRPADQPSPDQLEVAAQRA